MEQTQVRVRDFLFLSNLYDTRPYDFALLMQTHLTRSGNSPETTKSVWKFLASRHGLSQRTNGGFLHERPKHHGQRSRGHDLRTACVERLAAGADAAVAIADIAARTRSLLRPLLPMRLRSIATHDSRAR